MDDETRIVRFLVRQTLVRYDRVEREGETFYQDRYFDFLIRLEDFVDQVEGLPIFASGRTVHSAPDYAEQRRDAIAQELETGAYSEPEQSGSAT
jgi:hypothetical protein